jgi:hypothetical protein
MLKMFKINSCLLKLDYIIFVYLELLLNQYTHTNTIRLTLAFLLYLTDWDKGDPNILYLQLDNTSIVDVMLILSRKMH